MTLIHWWIVSFSRYSLVLSVFSLKIWISLFFSFLETPPNRTIPAIISACIMSSTNSGQSRWVLMDSFLLFFITTLQ